MIFQAIYCRARSLFRTLILSAVFSLCLILPAFAGESVSSGGKGFVDIPGVGECLLIDSDSFPDDSFRAVVTLTLQKYGAGIAAATGGADPFFTVNDQNFFAAAALPYVTGMDASGKGISSLEGIQYFPYLSQLSVSGNSLTTLDLSGNTALTALDASSNALTSLNISKCSDLSKLNAIKNSLTALDISGNKKLTAFACTYNAVGLLDFRGNTVLDPFSPTSFNIAFQKTEPVILCDPGSPMERYCRLYHLSYSYSLMEKRPVLFSDKDGSVLMVRERADLSALLSSRFEGEKFSAFSASPEGIVKISKKGIITGKKTGTVTITASGSSGKTAEYGLTVEAPSFREKKVKSVSVNETIFAESFIQGTSFRPDSYLSSNTDAAEIDPVTGRITTKAKGKTKITAYYGSGKDACKISFLLNISVPYLNKDSLYLEKGKSFKLKLKGTKEKPVFYSADEKKVSISPSTGEMTAVSTGTTDVFAVLNGAEYRCRVTVVK